MAIDANEVWGGFQQWVEEPEGDTLDGVARDILDTFDIPINSSESGGVLLNVDIKRADPLSTLKASLLETYANDSSSLLEIRINPQGEAEFYRVGQRSSSISPYYSIASRNYSHPSVGVQVTGGKPRQERIVYDSWYPLIGENAWSTVYDTTMLKTGCYLENVSTNVTITYRDPFRHSKQTSWNNGIEEVFELEAYDRMVGLTWRITPPETEVTSMTNIYQQAQSTLPVILTNTGYSLGDVGNFPNIGTPIKRRQDVSDYTGGDDGCRLFTEDVQYCSPGDTTNTIPLVLDMNEGLVYETVRNVTVNKFIGVREIFVLGIPLISCHGIAKPDRQLLDNNEENSMLVVYADSAAKTVVKLTEGNHYVTLYPDSAQLEADDGYLPCFQFANNLNPNDFAKVGTGVDFDIDSLSLELIKLFKGESPSSYTAKGTILPLDNLNGVIVEQVWAYVDLDTPCFVVTDPTGAAERIAQGLQVEIMPLVIRDEPRPIAINGTLVDQTEMQPDRDPTTPAQDFTNTEMETLLGEMHGRTLSISMSSLDDQKTLNLCKKLHKLLTDSDGAVYTHTCPPTVEPEVGNKGPKGGIINTVEYSYTDQGSYLINVQEGPEYFGDFAGIDSGIYYKQTEEVSTQGVIIQDIGNHVQYKVRVDGYGVINCINGCGEILTSRDRVNVTIHNNAVEG